MNVGLCGVIFGILWGLSRSESAAPDTAQTQTPIPERQTSLKTDIEMANLMGQMKALSQHPETMPPFDPTWVRKIAIDQIGPSTEYKSASTLEQENLIQSFVEGFHSRYDDYFDTGFVRKSGYHFGVKIDPNLDGCPHREFFVQQISRHKAALVKRYALDEAGWLLFLDTWINGFEAGYPETKDGVTRSVHEKVWIDFKDLGL